jgi:hypothetical protein
MMTNPHLTAAYKKMTKEFEALIEAAWESGRISDECMMQVLTYTDDPMHGLRARQLALIKAIESGLDLNLFPADEIDEIRNKLAFCKRFVAVIEEAIESFEQRNKFGVIEGGKRD